jgi:hypothetical protein
MSLDQLKHSLELALRNNSRQDLLIALSTHNSSVDKSQILRFSTRYTIDFYNGTTDSDFSHSQSIPVLNPAELLIDISPPNIYISDRFLVELITTGKAQSIQYLDYFVRDQIVALFEHEIINVFDLIQTLDTTEGENNGKIVARDILKFFMEYGYKVIEFDSSYVEKFTALFKHERDDFITIALDLLGEHFQTYLWVDLLSSNIGNHKTFNAVNKYLNDFYPDSVAGIYIFVIIGLIDTFSFDKYVEDPALYHSVPTSKLENKIVELFEAMKLDAQDYLKHFDKISTALRNRLYRSTEDFVYKQNMKLIDLFQKQIEGVSYHKLPKVVEVFVADKLENTNNEKANTNNEKANTNNEKTNNKEKTKNVDKDIKGKGKMKEATDDKNLKSQIEDVLEKAKHEQATQLKSEQQSAEELKNVKFSEEGLSAYIEPPKTFTVDYVEMFKSTLTSLSVYMLEKSLEKLTPAELSTITTPENIVEYFKEARRVGNKHPETPFEKAVSGKDNINNTPSENTSSTQSTPSNKQLTVIKPQNAVAQSKQKVDDFDEVDCPQEHFGIYLVNASANARWNMSSYDYIRKLCSRRDNETVSKSLAFFFKYVRPEEFARMPVDIHWYIESFYKRSEHFVVRFHLYTRWMTNWKGCDAEFFERNKYAYDITKIGLNPAKISFIPNNLDKPYIYIEDLILLSEAITHAETKRKFIWFINSLNGKVPSRRNEYMAMMDMKMRLEEMMTADITDLDKKRFEEFVAVENTKNETDENNVNENVNENMNNSIASENILEGNLSESVNTTDENMNEYVD